MSKRRRLWIPQVTGRGLPTEFSLPDNRQNDLHTTSTAAACTNQKRMEERNPGTPKTAAAAGRNKIPLGFRKSIWHFSTVQSPYFRLSSSPLAQALASGVQSIFSKDMATTIPALMLMYGKEASNRKQEIDRQHYTIPNQRPKDKHCGKI